MKAYTLGKGITMPKHLFDELPTDMIYYEIFPFLDYISRVNANLLLPKEDRIRTPLNKDALLEFTIIFQSTHIATMAKKAAITRNRTTRSRLILKIWRLLPMFPELIQYSEKVRDNLSLKALEFSTATSSDVSAYTLKTLKKLCANFLHDLETKYPYLREFNYQKGDWTAVTQ